MILLTDEEIQDVDDSMGSEDWRFGEAVAKAQLKKAVEYIDKNFYIGVDCNGEVEYEGDYRRWQALLEEV